MARIEQLRQWSGTNWFLLVAPALFAAVFLISRSAVPTDMAMLEAALLIDVCVTLPVLYALCYARSLPLWQLAVRLVGLACLGIYIIGYIVPPEAQRLLPSFAWARMIGLGVLVLFELWLLVTAARLVFGGRVTAEQVSATTGAPPWIARLMLLEARFWKAVWRFLRRGRE